MTVLLRSTRCFRANICQSIRHRGCSSVDSRFPKIHTDCVSVVWRRHGRIRSSVNGLEGRKSCASVSSDNCLRRRTRARERNVFSSAGGYNYVVVVFLV